MDKEKRSKRFQQKRRHIDRQVHHMEVLGLKPATPHKYHKKNALNCGNPNCVMCMNPRKAFGQPTMQEKREFERYCYEE